MSHFMSYIQHDTGVFLWARIQIHLVFLRWNAKKKEEEKSEDEPKPEVGLDWGDGGEV